MKAAALVFAVLLVSVGSFTPALGAPKPDDPQAQEQECAALRRAERLARQHVVQVFMVVDATRAQIRSARAFLRSSPAVERYRFLDRKAALREFKRIFKDEPDLVKSVTAKSLPTSFHVKLAEDAATDQFVAAAQAMPGVDVVSVPQTNPALKAQCAELGEG